MIDEVARRCAEEIIDLHRAFERWLGAAGEGEIARFEAAFAPGFTFVTPEGQRLDRHAVLGFLASARGSQGGAFRIAVEDIAVLHAAPPLMLLHYVERQWTGAEETARRTAALFSLEADGPRWLFAQETWIARPAE